MARPNATSGQDLSVDNVNLDDLSLDDDALFADLDNEVRLEGAGDDLPALEGNDDLDLNFDVEAVPSKSASAKSTPAGKSGNGKGASSANELNLDLGDAKLSDGDLDLNLDEVGSGGGELNLDLDDAGKGDLDLDAGMGGDLNLELEGPADSTSGGGDPLDLDLTDGSGGGDSLNLDLDSPGPGASGGDSLDLDISDAAGGDDLNLELESPLADSSGGGEDMLNLELGDAATAEAPQADELDLTLDMNEPTAIPAEAAGDDLDLNLSTDEPVAADSTVPRGASSSSPAAGDADLETFEFEMGDESMQMPASSQFGMSATSGAGVDLEDRSHPKGADQLEEMTVSEAVPGTAGAASPLEPVLDLGALPSAGEMEAPAGEFQAMPDLDLDSADLNLDQTASEFKAVPDVDLDTVDLDLNMPFAETRGDTGASIVPVAEPAAPEFVPRMFSGMGTGAAPKLEVAKDELLELNLSDLESKEPRGSAMAAASLQPMPSMAAAADAPTVAHADVGSVLLSIPHQVQVRMGSVSLLGQDILNLAHGSVVPLNRAVGEPVDLTLEGKTIAQGEIVLINGRNLGVRIVALSK